MSPQRTYLPIDDQFDTEFANRLAHYETFNKHHYRPNTYLHKWWGRRCGSTFRLILKGLTTAPTPTTYYQPGGLEGLVVLDPMMGGGTTLHEALRMGANVIGIDVDPIPVLQARASLQETDLAALERAFEAFYEGVSAEIELGYRTTCPECAAELPLRHVLYGQTRRCTCREVQVVDSLVLRRDANGTVWRVCPTCAAVYRGSHHDCPCPDEPARIIERQQRHCGLCGETFVEVEDRPYYARYQMLAIGGRCRDHGFFYKSPDAQDRAIWLAAENRRPQFGAQPEAFAVHAGDKSQQLVRRGITSYLELYSSRQLRFLQSVLSNLPEDPALRLNLALLASTSLEYNSMLAGYKGTNTRRAGAVRHTFSHHAYSFPYTALENNPVYPGRSSGTLMKLFYGRLLRGRQWAQAPRERVVDGEAGHFVTIAGEQDFGAEAQDSAELATSSRKFMVRQKSAAALPLPDHSVDAVVTDPPYYNSIQYDDLAAYFRVWLRQMLPDAADWSRDDPSAIVNTSGDGEGWAYAESMRAIWCEVRRVLKPGSGRLVFTFHHWHPEAWAALTVALHAADFRLVNRYVVHAENPISVHINKMRALTHDVVLVLAADESARQGTAWPKVIAIPQDDSGRFCAACGALLGYLLDREAVTFEECLAIWRRALAES